LIVFIVRPDCRGTANCMQMACQCRRNGKMSDRFRLGLTIWGWVADFKERGERRREGKKKRGFAAFQVA